MNIDGPPHVQITVNSVLWCHRCVGYTALLHRSNVATGHRMLFDLVCVASQHLDPFSPSYFGFPSFGCSACCESSDLSDTTVLFSCKHVDGVTIFAECLTHSMEERLKLCTFPSDDRTTHSWRSASSLPCCSRSLAPSCKSFTQCYLVEINSIRAGTLPNEERGMIHWRHSSILTEIHHSSL